MAPALENNLSLVVCVAGIDRYLRATLTRDGYRWFPFDFHQTRGSSVRARRGLFKYSAASSAPCWPVLRHAAELRLEKTPHTESSGKYPRPVLVPAVSSWRSFFDMLSSTAFDRRLRAHFFFTFFDIANVLEPRVHQHGQR